MGSSSHLLFTHVAPSASQVAWSHSCRLLLTSAGDGASLWDVEADRPPAAPLLRRNPTREQPEHLPSRSEHLPHLVHVVLDGSSEQLASFGRLDQCLAGGDKAAAVRQAAVHL